MNVEQFESKYGTVTNTYVGFYSGDDGFISELIKYKTSSIYSHCGLAFRTTRGDYIIDSCFEKGVDGVCIDEIDLSDGSWLTVSAPLNLELALRNLGQPYDILGIITAQLFNFKIHRKNKTFCSEFVAEHLVSIGYRLDKKPYRYHPEKLLRELVADTKKPA